MVTSRDHGGSAILSGNSLGGGHTQDMPGVPSERASAGTGRRWGRWPVKNALLLVVVVCMGPGAVAQPLERGSCEVRAQNSRQMDLTLELDRAEYMPSEVLSVSLSFRNGTGRPLEVFDPWGPGAIHLKFANDLESEAQHPEHPKGLRLRRPESELPNVGPPITCGAPAVVVQPGEMSQRRLRSDRLTNWQPKMFHATEAPYSPGDYLLVATYGGREYSAPLRVVKAEATGYAELKLRRVDT